MDVAVTPVITLGVQASVKSFQFKETSGTMWATT